MVGAQEIEFTTPEEFLQLNQLAASNRTTKSTYKNDTSSRSHAVCKIRIQNTHLQSMEDGELFIIDLAGSESTSDSQFHDKDLIKQAQFINYSLMSLKECIRNRALSVQNYNTKVHIPYRNSSLTHILKDSFEMSSMKNSKTVIIANVSPSVVDIVMTKNTLRFISPIKIGAALKKDMKQFEVN